MPTLYAVSRIRNKIHESYHSARLADVLRYTSSIYSLIKQLEKTDLIRNGWISGIDSNPGTRVVRGKPQFICVEDYNAIKDKVQESLHKLNEEGIGRDEIAVIKTEVSKDIIKDMLQEDSTIRNCPIINP
jgi:hypothetical protein